MAKVTSVVVSWTLDSLHRRGRSACAVYYSDKISESLSRVDSFKHESRRRVGVDALKFRKERLVVAFEERGACKPAKYFPIPLTFLSTVFAKILADRLTTSLKPFRSKIINHRLDIRLAYSLDPTIISNKLRITKRKDVGKREREKKQIEINRKKYAFSTGIKRIIVFHHRSSALANNNKDEQFLGEKDEKYSLSARRKWSSVRVRGSLPIIRVIRDWLSNDSLYHRFYQRRGFTASILHTVIPTIERSRYEYSSFISLRCTIDTYLGKIVFSILASGSINYAYVQIFYNSCFCNLEKLYILIITRVKRIASVTIYSEIRFVKNSFKKGFN